MDFSSMSGWDFERYCADCLLKKGFTKAEVTSGSGDHGVDIIAEQNGIRFGIQCKLYQGQIPNKAVQEAYTGASYYDCDVAVIMSNSELTKQAQTEAKKLRVKFWDVADYTSGTFNEGNKKSSSARVTTYDDYCRHQKDIERQRENQAYQDIIQRRRIVLAVENPYEQDIENIRVSKSLLKQDCVVESILCFCKEQDFCNHSKAQVLLKKLSYVKELNGVLSKRKDGLAFMSENQCAEIDRELRLAAENDMTMSQDEFNQKYWYICYIYENFRQIISILPNVFADFNSDELIKIEDSKRNGWHRRHTVEEDTIYELRDQLDRLLGEFKELLYEEIKIQKAWYFWQNDKKITTEIQQHRQSFASTEESFINERNRAYEKLIFDENQIELNKQRQIFGELLYNLRRKRDEEELERQEKERLFKEQLLRKNAEREREKKLKEEQESLLREQQEKLLREQKEKEALLKRQQEKDALVRSLISAYNDECYKINAKTSSRRKELERKAQVATSQAQEQITDLLKKKQPFTFFRKERDAKIDATIATVEQHIERLKNQLECDIVKCDSEAQEKIKALQEQTLDEAEKGRVKEELLKNLNLL